VVPGLLGGPGQRAVERGVGHGFCVDLKLWDEIADVFTPDATVDYGTRALGQPAEAEKIIVSAPHVR